MILVKAILTLFEHIFILSKPNTSECILTLIPDCFFLTAILVQANQNQLS
jgi:hypothetical protein